MLYPVFVANYVAFMRLLIGKEWYRENVYLVELDCIHTCLMVKHKASISGKKIYEDLILISKRTKQISLLNYSFVKNVLFSNAP